MIVTICLAVNLVLYIFYKSAHREMKQSVLTHGWAILVHEFLHYIPAFLLGLSPKLTWGSVDLENGVQGIAAVNVHGIYGERWNFDKDWIVSCTTYLLPAATVAVIPFVDYVSALYLGWVTVRCYLASHYDEKMHFERIFNAQLHGWK